MQLKFLSIAAQGEPEVEAELNRFLASHRIVAVDRNLVQEANGCYWAICVEYLATGRDSGQRLRAKVDYREVLSEREFTVYAELRSLRKTLAEREGVPAYALFTNEQLAQLVRSGVTTTTDMASIEGVGKARIEKYGAAFLDVLQRSANQRTDAGQRDEAKPS